MTGLPPVFLAVACLSAAAFALEQGESCSQGRYSFCADYSTAAAQTNKCPLLDFKCKSQSRSWWFHRNSFVTYRHVAPAGAFTNAYLYLSTTVHHKSAYGEIVAEVRTTGGAWRTIGILPHHSSARFDLPPELFPARALEIRMRAEKSCSLQVAKYFFSGETDVRDEPPCEYGAWGVSSGVKVRRKGPIGGAKRERLVIRTAANEAEAGQIVVTPAQDVADLRVAASPLVCAETGAALPPDAVQVLRVEYVPVTVPSDWKGAVGLWPDPLPPQDGRAFPVQAGENQPFWVVAKPPKGTAKGVYRGALKVEGGAALSLSLPFEVEVFGFELPDEMTCKSAFGIKPTYAANRYQKPRNGEERRAIVERCFAFMSDHHFSPSAITFFVKREKKEGLLDWKDWDREVARVLGKYHFNTLKIHVNGLGGGNQFRQKEPSFQGVSATNAEYHVRMGNYLGEIERHLREKGWLDKAYVYWYDEPGEKDYPFVRRGFETLKRHAPGLKGMLTKQPSEALLGCVDIWCPQPQRLHVDCAAAARARGDGFWWYVCNNPPAPYVGEAIDHPGPEMRVWLWQTWGEKVSGVLIWRCELWDRDGPMPEDGVLKNPYRDPMTWFVSPGTGARHPTVNGEAVLMYPPKACFRDDGSFSGETVIEGPVSSMRAEHLRDGIEDYEYFAMLKRLDANNPLLAVPKDVYASLTSYAEDTEAIERHRLALAREIERLNMKGK